MASIRPTKINVTLKGLKRDLKLLNPLSLRVSLRLEGVEEGEQKILISEQNLRIPGALQLVNVGPPIVTLKLIKIPRKPTTFLGIFSTSPKKEKTVPSQKEPGEVPTVENVEAELTIEEMPLEENEDAPPVE